MSFFKAFRRNTNTSARSSSEQFTFSEQPLVSFRKNPTLNHLHYSYQGFKDLLVQLKYCESKVLLYLNSWHHDQGGVCEENLEILNDMTNSLVFLNALTDKFLPDKKGKSWFSSVLAEIEEEEELDIEQARKTTRNSTHKKKAGEPEVKETRRISFKNQRRNTNRRMTQSLAGSIAQVAPARYYSSDGLAAFDFKQQFLQPEHLSYFIEQYSSYPEILTVSNKINKIEDYLISTQLRIQNEHQQIEKEFQEALKESAEEADKSVRELVRNYQNLFQKDPKMNELLLQYILKINYLDEIAKKTTKDLERIIETSYQTQEQLKHSFKVIQEMQVSMPASLQSKLKEQVTEVLTYFEQLDMLVMMEEQLAEQDRMKSVQSSQDEIAYNLQSSTKWEIQQSYLQKKEEYKQVDVSMAKVESHEKVPAQVVALAGDIKNRIVKNEQVAPLAIQNLSSPQMPYLSFQIGAHHFSYSLIPIHQSQMIAVDVGESKVQILHTEDFSKISMLDLAEAGKGMSYFGIEVGDALFIGCKDHLFEFSMNSTDPYSLEEFSRESFIQLKSHGRCIIQHTNNKVNEQGKYLIVGETGGWVELVECEKADSSGSLNSDVIMRYQLRNCGHIYSLHKTRRNTEIKDIKSGLEYLLACQKGVHFATVLMDGKGKWEVQLSNEYYLPQNKVLQVFEYEVDKFFVIVEGDPDITILDRKRKKTLHKIPNPSYQKPQPIQFHPFPTPAFPFVFVRDFKNLWVIDVRTKVGYFLLSDLPITDNAECTSSYFVTLGKEVPGMNDSVLNISQQQQQNSERKALEDYMGKAGTPEENKSALMEVQSQGKAPEKGQKKYQLEVNLIVHVMEGGHYVSKVIQYVIDNNVLRALDKIDQV